MERVVGFEPTTTTLATWSSTTELYPHLIGARGDHRNRLSPRPRILGTYRHRHPSGSRALKLGAADEDRTRLHLLDRERHSQSATAAFEIVVGEVRLELTNVRIST